MALGLDPMYTYAEIQLSGAKRLVVDKQTDNFGSAIRIHCLVDYETVKSSAVRRK